MRHRLPRILLVLAVGLLVVLVIVLLTGDDGFSIEPNDPQVVTVSELEEFADDAGHPIYWVGERPDTDYELTEGEDGRVFVRYLPAGAAPGEFERRHLTVATYEVEDGADALRRTARREDRREVARSDDGAVVLIDTRSPRNVHLAYPDEDVQIEVFSPDRGEALRLAARDQVVPVP